MDAEEPIQKVQTALKLMSEAEDKDKVGGLTLLEQVLCLNDEKLAAYGYYQVIFKELIKMAQFESDQVLRITLQLLETNFFAKKEHWDELAETLIYRAARLNDYQTSLLCLEKISTLIDHFDESIGKHSKQLLKYADLNDITDLNPKIIEILLKMKSKLPKRAV